jgi:hypothetical protein
MGLRRHPNQFMVAAMFIERVPNRTSPPAILIRESFREGKKVSKRTLANISKLPEPMIAAISQLIKRAEIAAPVADSFEIRRALPHGHVAAVLGTMRSSRRARKWSSARPRSCGR